MVDQKMRLPCSLDLGDEGELQYHRFGTEFTKANQLWFDQIMEDMTEDAELGDQARNNSINNFKREFDPKVMDAVANRIERNENIATQFLTNEKLRAIAVQMMMREVYERLQAPEARAIDCCRLFSWTCGIPLSRHRYGTTVQIQAREGGRHETDGNEKNVNWRQNAAERIFLMHTVAAIVEEMERFAPLALAADWDNVGLLLGDRTAEARRVMTCLTVTPESAAEAIDAGVQLIVTHHPILFRAVKRLTADSPEGRMLCALLKAGVAVFSAHTAFDDTRGGINEALARRLGLEQLQPLRRREGPRSCKIVVFVPESDLANVSTALFAAGAGEIGQYRECSYRLNGTGTFFPTEGTNPTVSQKGQSEVVSEWRLEVVCPEARVESAVETMRQAHSYEEPAFDVYPLRSAAASVGSGRVGRLASPEPLDEFARRVRTALNAGPVQTVGNGTRRVERVAIACGAAGEMMNDALRAKVDVFLTGEMRFHDLLAARAQGLALCLPGHHATERFALEELAEHLQEKWPGLEVWASQSESDPVHWV